MIDIITTRLDALEARYANSGKRKAAYEAQIKAKRDELNAILAEVQAGQ